MAAAILPRCPAARRTSDAPPTPERAPHVVPALDRPPAALQTVAEPQPEAELEVAPQLPEQTPRSRTCDTKLRLSAPFYDERRPEPSYAVIGRPMPRSATLYRPARNVNDYKLARVLQGAAATCRSACGCERPASRALKRARAAGKTEAARRVRAAFSSSELDA